MSKLALAIAAIVLAAAIIVFFPMITIWALNTLFHFGIPVTLGTWFAAMWLSAIVSGSIVAATSKKS